MRICIAGVPRAGKSTLAEIMGHSLPVIHGDDYQQLGWSEASEAVADFLDREGHGWVVEGVLVPRALRKWMAANDGKPCDVLYWLEHPRVELSDGQARMGKGCRTVLEEILPELVRRGVDIICSGRIL